jgi:hypothetical protein
MKIVLAALLFAPALDGASCFTHPETRTTYCAAASECPQGMAWSQQTQACMVATAAPTCDGVDAGVTPPTALTEPAENARHVAAGPTTWIRVKGVVHATGIAQFVAVSDGMAQFYLSLPVPTTFRDSLSLSGAVSTPVEPVAISVAGLMDTEAVNFRIERARAGQHVVLQYSYAYPITGCN